MQLVTLPVPNPLPPSLELAPSPSTDLAVDQQQVPNCKMRAPPEEDTALFEHNSINFSIIYLLLNRRLVVYDDFSSAVSKDYIACVAQWSLFFCGYRVSCVLILHLRMGFDKKESIEKVLTLDLPGHHSHSSLHLSFLFSYHTTSPTTRTLPKPPSQSCGNFSPSLSLTRIYHQLRFKVTGRHRILVYPTVCSNYKADVTYSKLPQRLF